MITVLLLPPADERGRLALVEAVHAQTRRPDEVRVLDPSRSRAQVFAHALSDDPGDGTNWWWLLDGAAIPRPDALGRLLRPLDALGPLPSPVLLASKVLDPDGRLDADRAPWPRLLRKEVSLDACERYMLSVRAARHGSLLVNPLAIRRYGLPRADYRDGGEDLEWTARLLRQETGYLVPASIAVRLSPATSIPGSGLTEDLQLPSRFNMLRGSAWDEEEKLWFGFLLAQDIARGLRRAPRPAAWRATLGALREGLALPVR